MRSIVAGVFQRRSLALNLKSDTQGDCLIIKVAEPRIDAAAAVEFKDTMRGMVEDGPSRVILDLGDVDSIDSSGLGAIVAIMKMIGPDRKLELCALSNKVKTVFRLTRMDAVVTIHNALEDALSPLPHAS